MREQEFRNAFDKIKCSEEFKDKMRANLSSENKIDAQKEEYADFVCGAEAPPKRSMIKIISSIAATLVIMAGGIGSIAYMQHNLKNHPEPKTPSELQAATTMSMEDETDIAIEIQEQTQKETELEEKELISEYQEQEESSNNNSSYEQNTLPDNYFSSEETTDFSEGYAVSEEYSAELATNVEEFITYLMNKDADKLAFLCATTPDEVNSWLQDMSVTDYEIINTYSDIPFDPQYLRVQNQYVLVKMTITGCQLDIFENGTNYYKIYAGDAGAAIGAIIKGSESMHGYLMDEIDPVKTLCERYQYLIGLDFEKDKASEVLSSNLSSSLRDFAYINHDVDSINSMEDLSAALEENIYLSDFEWNMDYLKHNDTTYADYQLIPRGSGWNYTGYSKQKTYISDNVEKSDVLIDYYADSLGFVIAKTVNYEVMIFDGKPQILSVHTIYDNPQFEPAFGTV